MTSRESKRSRGWGKCQVRSRSLSPAASASESEASHAASEALETGMGEFQDIEDTDLISWTGQKTKKAKVVTDLTNEEEESMVEWLSMSPIIYNKKLQAYKDTAKKEMLWMEKATEMGKSVLILKTWYNSLRSRYGRLKKKWSGEEDTEADMSERDLWIVRRFEFLRPHIYEVHRRSTVVIKQEFAATSPIPGVVEDEDDGDASRLMSVPIPSTGIPSMPRSNPKPMCTEADDAHLVGLEEHSQQIMALQQEVTDRVKPNTDKEREAFVEWMKCVILDLDHSIWRRCQQDISPILFRYIGENDKLKRQVAPAPSTSFSGSSGVFAMCRPPQQFSNCQNQQEHVFPVGVVFKGDLPP